MKKLIENLSLAAEIIFLIIKYICVTFKSIYQSLTSTEKSVNGEIVLITGAGHGIGRELAIQYGQLGGIIVCWDINEEMNNETVNFINKDGGKAYGYTVDVTNRQIVLETSTKVLQEAGDVTILINNAGIMRNTELLKYTEKDIRATIDINILAHFWMLEAFLPKMIENNKGHIVGVSSVSGILPTRNFIAYCSSKYAVRGLMECLFEELRANFNIKITTIFPYLVNTGLFEKAKIRFRHLMPVLDPKEVAASIISAQRRELHEASIPRSLFHMVRFLRIFPNDANVLITDFVDCSIAVNQK